MVSKVIKKFNRSLGSKREQGIVTPKDGNRKLAKEGKRHAMKRMFELAGIKKPEEKKKKSVVDRATDRIKSMKKIIRGKANS